MSDKEKTIENNIRKETSVNNNYTEKSAARVPKNDRKHPRKKKQNEDKIERVFQRLEKKLKTLPVAGNRLSEIPIMASLIRYYIKKEYTDIPIGSVAAIIFALIYLISPLDIIPDRILFWGYLDDAAVIIACWKLVDSDIEEYEKWREENGKIINI